MINSTRSTIVKGASCMSESLYVFQTSSSFQSFALLEFPFDNCSIVSGVRGIGVPI